MPSGEYEKEFDYLQKMEDESDQVEVEIADYLTKVSESRLTSENSQRVRAMFKIRIGSGKCSRFYFKCRQSDLSS